MKEVVYTLRRISIHEGVYFGRGWNNSEICAEKWGLLAKRL